jgi:hypothetical protein
MDTDATTAVIDTSANCIAGLPLANVPTYFYTKNFVLPEKPTKVYITSRTSIPSDSSIDFGISTSNSLTFSDFTALNMDTVNDIVAVESNLKIGIEFLWSGTSPTPYIPIMVDYIEFYFTNGGSSDKNFHFRIRFYEDDTLVNLYYTVESRYDQDRWLVGNTDPIPVAGYYILIGQEVLVSYFPDISVFQPNRAYYLIIDVWDGTSYTSTSSGHEFMVTSGGSSVCDKYGYLPQVKNFAVLFEMEDNSKIMLNL